ncbi:MAG: hypothetical protein JWL81_379 [Verrucomicrobiales bacterium]|nr:hypothetical protein [Verrucomicrobiales bacterium]
MPQKFTCPNCRHPHRFLAALAGQSMHCHQCGFFFRIPLVPLASPEGVDFSKAKRWLLRLASGRQFGPVQSTIIQEWLREGRANADCIVAPEPGTKWYRLTEVFFPDNNGPAHGFAPDAAAPQAGLDAAAKTITSAATSHSGASAASAATSASSASAGAETTHLKTDKIAPATSHPIAPRPHDALPAQASAGKLKAAAKSRPATAPAKSAKPSPRAAPAANTHAKAPTASVFLFPHVRSKAGAHATPQANSSANANFHPNANSNADATLSPAAIIPATGLLGLWDDCSQASPRGHFRAIFRSHAETLKSLESESAQAGGLLRMRGSALVHLESERPPRHPRQGPDPLRIEAVTITAWAGPLGSEFYCLIPWSPIGRLPHEFLSILPGRLPAPVALRRATEDAFAGGSWIGITGDNTDIMAHAAEVSREALHQDISWQWHSDNGRYQMILVWGVQSIPLGPEKFAHLIQTAVHPDPRAPAGLRWYLDRQSSFWRFARRLNLPGAPGSPVLFSSCGARLLTLAAERLGQSPVA